VDDTVFNRYEACARGKEIRGGLKISRQTSAGYDAAADEGRMLK
jgi:hypothetical protein